MKILGYLLIALLVVYGCASTQNDSTSNMQASTSGNDTVRIANDSLEYEIIIIEPGFNTFLNSIAKPEGYYSQNYLENKNRFLVVDYNFSSHIVSNCLFEISKILYINREN